MTYAPQTPMLPRLWKALFVGLVVVTCFRVWSGPAEVVPRAQAQIPNAGAQRLETIQLARETNRLLSEILTTLRKSTLNVRVVGDEDGEGSGVKGGAAHRRR